MENEIVISANKTVSSEYVACFEELKSRYRSSQLKAGLSVNRELLQFNWNLGKDIVEKKAEEKWGSGIIERLSLDFKNAFPTQKGFSTTNLWYMKKWYLFYAEKVHQAGGEILELLYKVPWRHHVEIISKCKDKDETKVEWSFDGINKPLGVASYELNIKSDNFKNSLPTIEEIESEIK